MKASLSICVLIVSASAAQASPFGWQQFGDATINLDAVRQVVTHQQLSSGDSPSDLTLYLIGGGARVILTNHSGIADSAKTFLKASWIYLPAREGYTEYFINPNTVTVVTCQKHHYPVAGDLIDIWDNKGLPLGAADPISVAAQCGGIH